MDVVPRGLICNCWLLSVQNAGEGPTLILCPLILLHYIDKNLLSYVQITVTSSSMAYIATSTRIIFYISYASSV